MTFPVRMSPSGDQCLVVEFGEGIDPALNRRILAFARRVKAQGWAHVGDIVPSWTGVGLYYRADAVPLAPGESPLAAMQRSVRALLEAPLDEDADAGRLVEIPVCYGDEFGPDLAEAAQRCGMATAELIDLHTATTGRVFMVGFAPGHPFIGLWDARMAIPRRTTPRTRVPAGTVAIANRQTNIYPFDLPGGWNLLGRTPLVMFDPARAEPCLLNPGDNVRFVAISRADYDAMKARPA